MEADPETQVERHVRSDTDNADLVVAEISSDGLRVQRGPVLGPRVCGCLNTAVDLRDPEVERWSRW